MAYDFPASPTDGQIFSPAGGPSWVFQSPAWRLIGSAPYVPDSIASVPADMYAGFATSGNRFVINDKVDGTGTNQLTISDAGAVSTYGSIYTASTITATGTIATNGDINIDNPTFPTMRWYRAGVLKCTIFGQASNIVIDSNNWPLYLNSGTALMNLTPAVLYVGPRTAGVGSSPRLLVSYLGLGSQVGISTVAESAAGTSFPMTFNYPPSSQVGTISHNTTTTAFNTTSDARLKEFTGKLSGEDAAAIIRADPARRFNWTLDGSPAVGWSAQDSYAVSQDLATPGDDLGVEARSGDEGFQPWGMDQAKRTPYLWAALAMALDKIDALEARLAALEGT